MSSGDAGGEGAAVEGSSILLNQPIVLDNGTASVKAGFAGGAKPKVGRIPCALDVVVKKPSHNALQVVIATKLGRAKHMRVMPGGALEQDQEFLGPSSVFIGRKLDDHRGAFVLEYPMDKGRVLDGRWDAMERVWEV